MRKGNNPMREFPKAARTLGPLVVVAALVLSSAHSLAGPPFQTDDPDPVEYRHWEVYLATQWLRNADGTSGTLPHVEVNYGILPDTQLHAIVPMAYAKPPGQGSSYGLGDVELGVKHRFVRETGSRPMIGVFPLLELPTGDEERNLGNGRAQLFLPLWVQKSFGPWTTYGGGGYWIHPGEGNRNWWFLGWLIQRKLSKSLTAGAELFYKTKDIVNGKPGSGFAVGAIHDFDEGHHLLVSAGRGFGSSTEAEHARNDRFSAYLAYQWTF